MATDMVNEVVSLINKQIDSHEEIRAYLLQAGALIDVALNGGFVECEHSIIVEYLSVLSDIIIQSQDIQECAFKELQKSRKQYHFRNNHCQTKCALSYKGAKFKGDE